ncbi:MAG: methyltransferase domain-containing protein [Dehalococcoidia bacterium]|nr:methyltransferase domain-containing protein [Dehalococcoidia bacterium]
MTERVRFTNTDDWRETRRLENSAAFLAPYIKPGMSVIDCGCGPGTITCDLAEAVFPGKVVGVDRSQEIVGRATGIARERGLTNVHFEHGDINKLRFADGTFEAALESSTLQYLPRPSRAVREIFRVLKPGGVFGARDRDYRGDLFGNPNAVVRAAWRMHYQSYKQVNGLDLTLGGRLRDLLHAAGFEELINTATYEDHGDQEGARWIAAFYTRNFDSNWYVSQILERGFATSELLEEWRQAWQAWGEDPRSFYSIARSEVVGWKPI